MARNFSYTQACKITLSGNTVRQHHCVKQSRAESPDCAPCILPNIYKILPNYKTCIANNIAKTLPIICKFIFIERFILTMDPVLIVLLKLIQAKFEMWTWGPRPTRPPPVPPSMVVRPLRIPLVIRPMCRTCIVVR